MSIVIQNIDKHLRATGRHDYVLKINDKVIAYFTHERSDGLATCLRLAAVAAEDRDRQEIKDAQSVLDAILGEMSKK